MITLTDAEVSNQQDLSSGQPDGSSLWFLSGLAKISFQAASNNGQQTEAKESYRLLVGPVLTGPTRAIAIASAARVVTRAVVADVSVQAIEADLDDESGRVQLTFEASLMVEGDAASPAFGYVRVEDVAYQVTIHGTAAA